MPGTNHSGLLPRASCRPETSPVGRRAGKGLRQRGADAELAAAHHQQAGATRPAWRVATAMIVVVFASLAGVESAVQRRRSPSL